MNTRLLAATILTTFGATISLQTALAQTPRVADRTAPRPSATRPTSKTPVDPERVLALAPADSLFLAYTSDLPLLLENPLLKFIQKQTGKPGKLLEAISAVSHGAAFFSFSGVPSNPMTWSVTLGARTALPRARVVDIFTSEITRQWNDTESLPGQISSFDDGRVLHITLVGPATLNLGLAVKDNLIFASGRPFEAQAWLDSSTLPDRFADGEDHARIVQGWFSDPDALLYVNTRPFRALVQPFLTRPFPRLYEALQLDNVEFLASVTRRATPPDTAETNGADLKRTNSVAATKPPTQRIAIGLARPASGLWQAVLGTPGRLSLARYFPGNSPLFINGSMESAADIVDNTNAFVAMIGQEIVDEYEQERRDFQRDTGIDPHSDFLANLSGEWAVAGPFNPSGGVLVAVRLGDVATFRTHFLKLKAFFDLRTRKAVYRSVAIELAKRVDGEFYFAVIDDVLLAAADGRVLKSAIDAYADDTSLANNEAFLGVMGDRSDTTTELAYANMEFFTEALREEEQGEPDEFTASLLDLLAAQRAIGAEVGLQDRLATLDLASAANESLAPSTLIATVIMPSLARSRELSQRLVSQSNIKGIATSVIIYQANHDGQMPPNLKTLLASGNFTANTLKSPYDLRAEWPGGSFYLYRPLPEPQSVENPADAVILSEPELREGGANFGFLNGHTEWIKGPRAAQLLRVMKTRN
ncbi:MAG: DUF3352 domain-containing protein [Phycisphaerae bacterium]